MRHSNLFILLISIAASIGLMGGVLASGVLGARLSESCTPGVPEAMSSVWAKGMLFFAVPMLGTVLGGLSGWFVLRQLSDPAYRSGHCAGCGYNLRDLPSSACPECGASIDRRDAPQPADRSPNHA